MGQYLLFPDLSIHFAVYTHKTTGDILMERRQANSVYKHILGIDNLTIYFDTWKADIFVIVLITFFLTASPAVLFDNVDNTLS